jgi:predicted DNA-binding transcriptional regulator AlpA
LQPASPQPSPRERRNRTTPPRALKLEEAANYVGLAERKFAELVDQGVMPRPFLLARGIRRWDRRELDACIDQLPRLGEAPGPAPGAVTRRAFRF